MLKSSWRTLSQNFLFRQRIANAIVGHFWKLYFTDSRSLDVHHHFGDFFFDRFWCGDVLKLSWRYPQAKTSLWFQEKRGAVASPEMQITLKYFKSFLPETLMFIRFILRLSVPSRSSRQYSRVKTIYLHRFGWIPSVSTMEIPCQAEAQSIDIQYITNTTRWKPFTTNRETFRYENFRRIFFHWVLNTNT